MGAWFERGHEALRDERGQGLIEYGLIIVVVAVALIATLIAFGGQLNTLIGSIADRL